MTRAGVSVSAAPSSSGMRAKVSSVPTMRAVPLMRATKNRSLTTPTTLIVLLLNPQPVFVPLGQVGQRREVAHPVEVDLALEMVGLVLDDAREKLLRDHVDPGAVAVVRLEPDRGLPWNHAAHVRHREASLPAVLQLIGDRRHHRIDEHGQRDGGRLRVAWIALSLDDADLLEDMHLRGGQPRAVVLAHGLDQVLDEPLDLGRPDLIDGYG